MDEKKETQKELFEEFAPISGKGKGYSFKAPQPRKKINISFYHEQIFFVIIIFIVINAVSYALGVEYGKRLRPAGFPKEKPAVETQKIEEIEAKESKTTEKIEEVVKKEPPRPKLAFTVQVATYRDREKAEKEKKEAEQKGYEAEIIVRDNFYVLCIGKFANKKEASDFSKTLKGRYKDCFVRKR